MWVEVNENLLLRVWRADEPHTLLRERVRGRVTRGGHVARAHDGDVSAAGTGCNSESRT